MTPRSIAAILGGSSLAWALGGCGVSLDVGSNDAGVPYDADCKPGTYSGMYSCMTGSGDSSVKGPIAIRLEPSGLSTLAAAPDAAISVSISASGATSPLLTGTVSVSLAATLDCPTRKLTGTEGSVMLQSYLFQGTLMAGGTFNASYDADASPPTLVDGTFSTVPLIGPSCSWHATLE